jgi:hypothetical protein
MSPKKQPINTQNTQSTKDTILVRRTLLVFPEDLRKNAWYLNTTIAPSTINLL